MKGTFIWWHEKEHVQGRCCNLRNISEFLLHGLIRDVSVTPCKSSSTHFCHCTQVLGMWSAEPSLKGGRKATVWCLQFCFLHLTAGNNIILLCCLVQENPGAICLFCLYVKSCMDTAFQNVILSYLVGHLS